MLPRTFYCKHSAIFVCRCRKKAVAFWPSGLIIEMIAQKAAPFAGKDLCTMIFVPLLHYFLCKNDYSGNEAGLRYRLTPGKRTVPDPDGGEGATKEEKILTLDYWPDPWTLEKTDPALRHREVFPLTDEGREAAAQCLRNVYDADPESWLHCPDMMDCDPWEPPAEPDEATE